MHLPHWADYGPYVKKHRLTAPDGPAIGLELDNPVGLREVVLLERWNHVRPEKHVVMNPLPGASEEGAEASSATEKDWRDMMRAIHSVFTESKENPGRAS
jgi:hypothetical protein